jgi:hypothetical protein
MFWRLIPLGLLVAILFGCSSKNPPPAEGGNDPTEKADPNATYTIKFREAKQGDKIEVAKGRTATATVAIANSTRTQKEEFRYEYTESILEMKPDEPRPTKVTRVYKIAKRTAPNGEMKSGSYIGKTIRIEKYLRSYKYVMEGRSLPPIEQAQIHEDFTRRQWKLQQILPKTPVKIGEEWAIDFAAITALGGKPQTNYDKEKSKFGGKLVKVYQKDGHQWGVIELRSKLVIDTVATNGSPIKGEVNSKITYDLVIDGSLRTGNMKLVLNSTFDGRDMITGRMVKTTVEGTEDQSLKQVN